MPRFERANLALGLGVALLALVIAFVWVPLDSSTGLVEKLRRQVTIGDALAPTIAAGFLLLGGLMVAFFESPKLARKVSLPNLVFLATLLALLGFSFALMRWFGPLVASLLTDDGYRPLRDTAPWKHIGFVFGGMAMVAGLIGMVERKLSWRALLIGLAAAMALIIVYDLPFDNLLLPPNGDV